MLFLIGTWIWQTIFFFSLFDRTSHSLHLAEKRSVKSLIFVLPLDLAM
jgi:hypothetical protein